MAVLIWRVNAWQQLPNCGCCDDTCTKWKAILHSPSIALAGSTTSELCNPKKNNPTSSLPAAKRNIIFHRRKSRNKIANKMQKQGPMIQRSCSLITADAPLQMRTLAQKPSSGTHDSRIPWMHGTTYGWYMSDTRHHHGDSAFRAFLCSGWQPALRSVPVTPQSECEPDSLCCCW